MSYVLGWKTRSNVYLAADSMITSGATSIDTQSSFGERHICEDGVSVSERALKIVADEDLAIGLCGGFRLARNLAASIVRSFRRLRDPEAAIREMIASNGPFSKGCDAKLIIAWRGRPSPRLFAFNHDGQATLHEAGFGEGYQFGSARAMHKGMTWDVLKRFAALKVQEPEAHLTAALGLLQSYGLHDNLPQDGVGGAFTGLSVTRDAISWQPDVLYYIDEPDEKLGSGIATCVRDRNLIVISTITNEPRVFTTTLDGNYDSSHWFKKWGKFAQSYLTNRVFDYVVLLGLKRWVVIVIEMRRALESKMLRFHADGPTESGIHWFELHVDMISALRREFANPLAGARDFRFGFQPYEAGAWAVSEPTEETPRNRGVE